MPSRAAWEHGLTGQTGGERREGGRPSGATGRPRGARGRPCSPGLAECRVIGRPCMDASQELTESSLPRAPRTHVTLSLVDEEEKLSSRSPCAGRRPGRVSVWLDFSSVRSPTSPLLPFTLSLLAPEVLTVHPPSFPSGPPLA